MHLFQLPNLVQFHTARVLITMVRVQQATAPVTPAELKRRFAEVMQADSEEELIGEVRADGLTTTNHKQRVDPEDMVKTDDDARTGCWRAAVLVLPLTGAEFQATLSATSSLMPFLTQQMHQSVSTATNITNYFTGTCNLLTLLGGFLADSYLGTFWAITAGAAITSVGLGVLTFSTAYRGLQPARCVPTARTPCQPAGAQLMAPLYFGLFTMALGTGLVRPNTAALGAEQFDRSSRKEQKQGINFFAWFYSFLNVGLLVALTLYSYIRDNVGQSWGYGFSLAMYTCSVVAFLLGSRARLRPRQPTGSFLTRLAQVFVAAFRKSRLPAPPQDAHNCYDGVLFGSCKLPHTKRLRFLDRAAVIEEEDRDALHARAGAKELGWRLCSVTQVEEVKCVLQMLPIWACTAVMSLAVLQLTSLSALQGLSLDRSLAGSSPSSSLFVGVVPILFSLLAIPVYHRLLLPFLRRFTHHPHGVSPLQRIGASIFFAIFAMMAAAIVEKRRLREIQGLGLQDAPMGTLKLPMKMWWLVPQLLFLSQMDLLLFISQSQFFYQEASDNTRSMASSFTYTSKAMGYFCSPLLVNVVNKATRRHHAGSWLEAGVNKGGLENHFWMLVVVLVLDLLCFLAYAHHYHCKFDWHDLESAFEDDNSCDVSNNAGHRQPTQFPSHALAPLSKIRATTAIVHDIESFHELQWTPK